MEFSFFAYSASPKVNHTIRICRMMTTAIDFLNKNGIGYELKHLLFKYIHDNIQQQLKRNRMTHHREVESLYLLVALAQIGREYWLPESDLLDHFSIKLENGVYSRSEFSFLSHFSITVLLTYMRDKVRYKKLREFVEQHVVEKLKYTKAHCPNEAEGVMLFLDMVTCPWIADDTKIKASEVFGLDAPTYAKVAVSNTQWFTAWGRQFNLGRELDAKRSREVY